MRNDVCVVVANYLQNPCKSYARGIRLKYWFGTPLAYFIVQSATNFTQALL